jgi:hypothetical protein
LILSIRQSEKDKYANNITLREQERRRRSSEHLLRYYLSECIHKRATLLLI